VDRFVIFNKRKRVSQGIAFAAPPSVFMKWGSSKKRYATLELSTVIFLNNEN
jgi:hypothetical protein